MNTQEKIGRIIKDLRVKRGLSQEQFCDQCGIDQHYISNIENGQRNLSIDIIERIASFFGLSLSQFFVKVETYKESIYCETIQTSCRKDFRQEDFFRYMVLQGLSDSTITKYSVDVPNSPSVQDIIMSVTGKTDNMYHLTDSNQLELVIEKVVESDFNKIGHSLYSAGLKKYLKFLDSKRL